MPVGAPRRSAPSLVFKHSPYCGLSDLAREQVQAFAETHPECTVVTVDVIGQRAESRRLAVEFGVMHESPQALLLADGAVVWHASHRQITAPALAAAFVRASAATWSTR